MTPLKNIIIWFLGCLLCLQFSNVLAKTIDPSYEAPNPNAFANDLFPVISDGQSSKNIIYSPFGIQSSFAFAYIGAEGETSEEMRTTFKLGQGNKDEIIEGYGKLLKSLSSSEQPDAPQLKMANRIYVNEYYRLQKEFNTKAEKYFGAQAKSSDFLRKRVADEINNWVEKETDNKIQNILKETDIGEKTAAVLVSAIYFKGNWMQPFSEEKTEDAYFNINNEQKKQVKMMNNKYHFRYVDLPELEATAVELPYKNSNISMLIILPQQTDGLEKLEINLKDVNFNDICSKMKSSNVHISLPKFRLEYEINLEQPLTKLGLSKLFTEEANFQGLFDTPEKPKISAAVHKAVLDVNEDGSDAASSSSSTSELAAESLISSSLYQRFNADHPFFFAIRSKDVIYFTGHVSDF